MHNNQCRILVTGGAGFIASHFVKYLLRTYPQYHVINLDKLTYAGNLNNLKEIARHYRYSFVKGDIGNAKLVKKVMRQSDMVVHFAAETHVDRSIKSDKDFIQTNITGTAVLLEEARLAGIKRFVYISTDEVYGSRQTGYFNETARLNPSSPYAASKASAEMLVSSYVLTYGMDAVITRCSNNFGPHQYPEKIIPLFITNLLQGKKVPLYGTGKNVRDWIFVEDHVRALDLIMHEGKKGEIYNIAGEHYLSNIALTKIILKKMGSYPATCIKYAPDRLGHDFRYAIDCTKLSKLGFVTKTSFDTGINLTINWYKNNRSWWKK